MTARPDPRRWWALGLLSVAQFLVILDTSIIGVALPAIQDALAFTDGGLQWVFNAYVIAFGGLLLLGGRLSDLYGPRRVFAAGFVVLGGASLLAGLAQSSEALVAGRALMGVGAALIAPAALSIVMALFGGTGEMGKAMGIWGASAPAGGTAGVFLGGVITEWLDWRWVFLVNVPVAVAVLAVTPALLSRGTPRKGRLDLTGAFTVTGAVTLAVYAIVTANDVGWSSFRTVGLGAAAIALLGAFVAVEARRRDPLVPLGIFRVHNLSAANAVMALLGAAWIPMWFFLNLYLQQTLGYGAFDGGLALLPMTVAIMVLMVGVTGRILARFGYKPPLVAGLLLLGAAMVWFGLLPEDGSFWIDVLPPSLLAAVGMSLAYIPALISALSSAKPEEAGLASGLVNTTYQVGSALGLAAMTALATSVGSGGDGFRAAFFGAAAVAAAAAVVALVLVRRSPAAVTTLEQPLEQAA
ncbi:MAG: MFS transporter [Actinobacteria bacterium]|nr:MFS transporter [Actinomycetota bacterium]